MHVCAAMHTVTCWSHVNKAYITCSMSRAEPSRAQTSPSPACFPAHPLRRSCLASQQPTPHPLIMPAPPATSQSQPTSSLPNHLPTNNPNCLLTAHLIQLLHVPPRADAQHAQQLALVVEHLLPLDVNLQKKTEKRCSKTGPGGGHT